MKKLLKFLLIGAIVISVLVIVGVSLLGIYINRYKDIRVSDPSFVVNKTQSETLFFCYDFDNRAQRKGNVKQIEGAILDSGVKYKYVEYEGMPLNLINAFIAIEDKRFFEHSGIDYVRSGHAVVNYVFGGSAKFGGSTITQQLIKNLTGNDQLTAERKIKEAFSAINLEKEYDKTEILEMYLNIINLSDGCRGVGAAADYFFSKDISELTLSECATIASITNNPSKYNPRTHPENNIKRRNLVLKCMLELGCISEDEYKNAIADKIELQIPQKYEDKAPNSWYIDMAVNDIICDLSEKYDISKSAASLMLYSGGYHIYLAMDEKIQSILENYYSDIDNFPIGENGEMPQSSMIILDPYTGDILGVAGGVGEKTGNRIQNYATDVKRPSGSAIKPLSVYAPSFEKGLINWSSIISDTPIIEGNDKKNPWPMNANNKFVGDVDIQYAIEHSLNTVSVRLLHDLGNQVSFDFLKNKLMIKSLNDELDLTDSSLALGQPSYGITLRELVGGYTIFQEGIFTNPRSYYKVTDSDGVVVLDNSPHSEKVISRDNAAILTKLMEGVVDRGTARGSVSLDQRIDVAGKTGTTQFCADRYFVGYTPELLAGVWFGYDYPKSLSDFGGNYSIVFFDEVMSEIYEKSDGKYGKKSFDIPDNIVKLSYDKSTGKLAGDNGENIAQGWFSREQIHNLK